MRHTLRGLFALVLSCAAAVPARAQIAVVSSSTVEREALPGESWTGSIRLQNATDETAEAKIYQTDYTFAADGTTQFGEPGSTARSSASWTTLTPSYVAIPPRGTVSVAYRVAVPASGAALSGTYWSMIMVEGVRPGSAESSQRDTATVQVGIVPVLRYAIQLATHVPGDAARGAEVENVGAVAMPRGARAVRFDVRNSGERAYRPTLTLELFDEQGLSVGRFTRERGLLYPGTSLRQEFELGVPAGRYKAIVLVDTGDEDIFGAQFSLTL